MEVNAKGLLIEFYYKSSSSTKCKEKYNGDLDYSIKLINSDCRYQ